MLFNGAEPIRASTIEAFSQTFAPYGFNPKAVYPCYGLAEGTLFVTGKVKTELPSVTHVEAAAIEQNRVVCLEEATETTQTLVSCGPTWVDQKVVIVDPETRLACAPATQRRRRIS